MTVAGFSEVQYVTLLIAVVELMVMQKVIVLMKVVGLMIVE